MEEKRKMFNEMMVADLKGRLEVSVKTVAGKESELESKDAEIARLLALVDKKDAALQAANNRIKNIESGKAYRKFLKKGKRKRKKR